MDEIIVILCHFLVLSFERRNNFIEFRRYDLQVGTAKTADLWILKGEIFDQ